MENLFGKMRAGGEGEEAHWLSVSDLMAGLMIVFLFISVALMRNAFIERDKIREIAVAYQENQVAIYESLLNEFGNDLARWDAAIDGDTLSFEFRSPEVLFALGDTSVRPYFRAILSDFFPRYLKVLDGFRGSIDEIRIEGHTSSGWTSSATESEAYFYNMNLSQGRTLSVLEYIYNLSEISEEREWVKLHFSAVGFSSSRLVFDQYGNEDPERSRRVSFRVVTNADAQIRRIIE